MSSNGSNGKGDPVITFPCLYPIKIIGANTPSFINAVKDQLKTILGSDASWSFRESKNARFVAISIKFTATSEEQIKQIHALVKDIPELSMVL